jgi:hypothetical protein
MAAATTVIAGVGLAISAGSTAMSFAQAAKQQKNIRTAEAAADQAMQEASKRLEVNYMDTLSVQMQPYRDAQEAAIISGSQAIQAGMEAERGSAATAGRIQALQNQQQMEIRSAAGQELAALEYQSAMEDSRLADIGYQQNAIIAQNATNEAEDARQAKNAAISQGFQGVMTMAQQAANMVPLYMESRSAKSLNAAEADYNKMVQSGKLPSQYMKDGKPMSFQQAFGVTTGNVNYGTMDPFTFRDKATQQGIDWINQYSPMSYQFPDAQRTSGYNYQSGNQTFTINPYSPYDSRFYRK